MTAVVVVLTVVVLLLAVLVVGLLRSHAEILRALHDLGVNLEDGAPGTGPRTFAAGSRAAASRTADAPGAADPASSTGAGGPVPDGVVPAGAPLADRVGEGGLALPADGPLGDAHDLMGVTPRGDAAAVAVRGAPGLTLLSFLTSGCMTCLDFWDAFRDPANRTVGGAATRLVVLTRGPDTESPSSVAALAADDLDVLLSSEAFDDYSVPVAPYFVLVDGAAARIVGEGAAASFDQLQSLVGKALADVGGAPGGPRRSRRDVLRGGRGPSADEALEAAGIGPGHPSLHEDPQADRGAAS